MVMKALCCLNQVRGPQVYRHFKPQNTQPVPSTRSVTIGEPGWIPNEMSTAKNVIKLYPGVPGQAKQLHLEGLKPSMSIRVGRYFSKW